MVKLDQANDKVIVITINQKSVTNSANWLLKDYDQEKNEKTWKI